MICGECRDDTHGRCANLSRPGPESFITRKPNWCDCQHQPGTSLSPEAATARNRSLGATGEDNPAPVHLPA